MKALTSILPKIILLLLFSEILTLGQTAPTITRISPSVGPVSPVGGPVTIKGTNFGATQGSSAVTFGGISVVPSSWTSTQIVVPVPNSLAVGFSDVIVAVNGLSSNAKSFLVIPVITQESPSKATIGTAITLTGTSFGQQQGSSTVTFNGTATTPTAWTDTSITVPVPSGASDGPVAVSINGFASNGVTFYVRPSISGFLPNAAQVGATLTITGSGFGANQGVGGVTFNSGVNAVVQSWSDTSITVTVPQGATSGNVVVTSRDLISSSGLSFTVGVPPGIINHLSPTSGSVGSQVVITGSGFGSAQGSGLVTFNGVAALVTSWIDTRIAAVVPPSAATGNVVVTASGASPSNAVGFSVIAATVSLYPPSGPVGSLVTIGGSGFGANQASGSVTFSGVVIPVSSWSNTRITFAVPNQSALGTASVAVTPSGGSAGSPLSFQVTPGISSISPASGTPGTVITVQGTNFGASQGTGILTISGITANISNWSNTQITATVPDRTSSGLVQTTQAGLSSNPVTFNIACNRPVSTIAITPNKFSLFSGVSSPITVVNDCGQPISGATFSSADSTIAAITANTPPRVLGEGPGTTTVTATFGGLSAQATVNVFGTAGFADGTAVFSAAPASDANFSITLPAARTAAHDTALFFVDARPSALSIRATSLDGTQLWSTNLPPVGNFDLVPDNKGGLVASLVTAPGQATIESMDADGNLVWSYGVATNPSGSFGPRLSIASDDSVYFVDDGGNIVALDGKNGNPKFAVPAVQFPSSFGFGPFNVLIMSDGSACTTMVQNPLGDVPFTDFPNQPVVLELTCAQPNGAYSSSIVNTVTSTQVTDPRGTTTDLFGLTPSSVIPDENGNVLVLWGQFHQHSAPGQTTSNKSQLFLSSGGGQVQLPAACDNVRFNSFGMILGDANNVLVKCGAAPAQVSLVSMNLGSSSTNWIWSVPQGHGLSLNTASPGGGASATDITLNSNGFGAAQFNVVDVDGMGNAVYENWSITSNQAHDGLFYINDGMFIHGSDVSQDLVVATPNEADTAWSLAFAQGQGRANSVEFIPNQACSGFDETVNPRMLMIPAGHTDPALNSNRVIAELHGKIQNDVVFQSDNPLVTIAPASPTGNRTTLTITANATIDPTQTSPVIISAVSRANPGFVYGTMRAVVKPRLDGNVAMYKVIESVRNLTPQSVPTAASLQNYLNNNAWGTQANVFFNIAATNPVDLSVHYDLLPSPNGNGMLDDFQAAGTSVEQQAIVQALFGVNPQAGNGIAHTAALYINQFGPPAGCTRNCNIIEGLTADASHISFIEDPQAGTNSNSRENITAHEIGHGIAVGVNDIRMPRTENRSLMWKGRGDSDPANPCEIRDREWRRANPTPGDN